MTGSDTTTYVGWISDAGIWVVPGADADALPPGAGVIEIADSEGRPVTPLGVQVLVDIDSACDDRIPMLAWVGQIQQGDRLIASHLYRVLHPAPYGRATGVRPATSWREFEAGAPARSTSGLGAQPIGDAARLAMTG